MAVHRAIVLRGVEVHNLKHIDLDLPHRRLIVLCGVSGSGKSSLAFDTLYAEGQRRYIETFSAYTRQFLQRLERPAADRIDGLPPAIAVASKGGSRSSRSTIGTATEINDYLRLLFAKIGHVFCSHCGREVRRDTPQSVASELQQLSDGTRYLVTFPYQTLAARDPEQLATALREEGFVRAIVEGRLLNLDRPEEWPWQLSSETEPQPQTVDVVVDRLTSGATKDERVRGSLETAFQKGNGQCHVLVASSPLAPQAERHGEKNDLPVNDGVHRLEPTSARGASGLRGREMTIDGHTWQRIGFSSRLACDDCGREYPAPEPRLYSFNSPLGACPTCEGFGNVVDIDMDLVVPDTGKSLREGAIAPWNTPAYAHELEELLALADDFNLPADVPYRDLDERQRRLIYEGVPERNFGGLRGFFAWLERRKYKMHIRVYLSRWRSYRPCPACGGARLRPEALATRIGGLNIAEACGMKISQAAEFFERLDLPDWERKVGKMMLDQVRARLGYLQTVGLGYLTLDRTLRTLSGGESQRVALSSALGSSLVNMLYVLDEPSIGLHAHDTRRLLSAIEGLRNRGNTVVVVEHEEAMIRAADQVVEIGPAAGERGGRVVFQGTPAEMEASPASLTGDYLSGRRLIRVPSQRRPANHGWIRLAGARGNNLRNVTVEFPLGVLCVVTGVSGSGKSTLVEDTLYPALCRRLRKDAPRPLAHDDVFGDGQINDAIMIDQSPIGRSPRSNPVTYIKAFDEIRQVFAETIDARTHNYTPSHFSFNVEGGRCDACQGEGYLQIDMQFLADVYMKCAECQGQRYRKEILAVTYRGLNIADVLDMTVREAFAFFRGQVKVQARLKRLMDVGLDYLRLGQPANTLSGGESQRLKLAAHMSAARKGRTLFLLDEPSTGLHFSDIVQLVDCFEALLAVGHSLIVVEHNLQIIQAADYLIDLGPGAGDEGGRVVVQGTPEEVSRHPESITGRHLSPALEQREAVSAALGP
ncbi:MAG TPA: excinuclease ABC subunit UvrA [Pirellulales bacterium]|nr:excinuclease ABC subunit UvrA [Pirellulales bacterium]